jgi:undecaprenyl-diphosphatase
LGIVQGLTEFLPVSSSGHLVIGQHFFGLTEAALAFDVSVHLGTLVAVIIYFATDLGALIAAVGRCLGKLFKKEMSFKEAIDEPNVDLAILITAGSVPTAIMGFCMKDSAHHLFSSLATAGGMLIVTGVLLWATRWAKASTIGGDRFSIGKALLIGLSQGIAIIPGISRSGATIATGLFLGLPRERAARFSFLLSIPAVFGAGLLTAKDMTAGDAFSAKILIIGMVTSAVVGYAALALLVYIVKQGRMHLFAPYCWIIGAIVLYFGL